MNHRIIFPRILNLLTPVWPDRDNFIRVYEENIAPDMRGNFEKRPYGDAEFHTAGSVDPKHTPYDVLSVIICVKRGRLFPSVEISIFGLFFSSIGVV